MKVRIKKLHPEAVVPKYATEGSVGFDLVATEAIILGPGETQLIKTGLSFEIPIGFEMQVRPRSGTSLKTPLRVANSPGTIDSDFRGQVCVIITNIAVPRMDPDGWWGPRVEIQKGERIAQGVICPIIQALFEEVEELSSTDRGSGGFGSTGK